MKLWHKILVVGLVEHFKILQLTAIQVIGAVFFVMFIAANTLLRYYDRSGDGNEIQDR